MTVKDFSGLWHSRYEYHSSSRSGDFQSDHILRLHQNGRKLTAESTPKNSSYVIIKLTVDDSARVMVGSWQEHTEKKGYYKGAIYYGAIQLVVDPDGNSLRGKWVGFDKDGGVNAGPWELTRVKQQQKDVVV